LETRMTGKRISPGTTSSLWNRKLTSSGGNITKNTPITFAPPPPLLKSTPLRIITGSTSGGRFSGLKTWYPETNPVKGNCTGKTWHGRWRRTNSFNYFVVIFHYFAIFTSVKGVAAKTQRKEIGSLRGCEAWIFLASRLFKFCVGWIKALVFTPNPPILFPGKVDSLSLNPPYRKPA